MKIFTVEDIAKELDITGRWVRILADKFGRGQRIGKRLLTFNNEDLEFFKNRKEYISWVGKIFSHYLIKSAWIIPKKELYFHCKVN